VRPHFSEAVAFARGTQTPSSFRTEADELQFGYDASFRAHAGYQLGGSGGIRFAYWNLQGDATVAGSVGMPGEFIVDPFGNVVGSVAIIDPSDARFGAVLTGGDEIHTRASVETNIYDLEFTREICARSRCWEAGLSFGARIADIEQFYGSVVTASNGAVVGQGEFSADFIGAGPRLGVYGRQYFGCNRRFSLFASCHGALLLGQYDVRADTMPVPGFQTGQAESLTRSVPVLETELGAAWRFSESVHVSVGWLFQAWFDMGASGGRFGGFFAGADDANVMSFDGMFLRTEFSF